MKKRMLALALCAALLVGASACSQTEADSSSQGFHTFCQRCGKRALSHPGAYPRAYGHPGPHAGAGIQRRPGRGL